MTNIQQAVYTLIQRYVERQQLVLEALRDLRPDLIMNVENRGNSEFWEAWTPESWRAFVLENLQKPNPGYWGENQEWEYFLHGAGCRLIHKITQERIEWDLGSLHSFDKTWFVNHLEWLLSQNAEDETIATVKEWYENQAKLKQQPKKLYRPVHDAVFPVLEHLCQLGLLFQHHQYYTLTAES